MLGPLVSRCGYPVEGLPGAIAAARAELEVAQLGAEVPAHVALEQAAEHAAHAAFDLLLGATGDQVHHAAHRVGAVERGRRALDDLHPLDLAQAEAGDVGDRSRAAGDALPVDEDQHVLGVEALEPNAGATVRVDHLHARVLLQELGQIAHAQRFDLRAGDHLGGHHRVDRAALGAAAGDDGQAPRVGFGFDAGVSSGLSQQGRDYEGEHRRGPLLTNLSPVEAAAHVRTTAPSARAPGPSPKSTPRSSPRTSPCCAR